MSEARNLVDILRQAVTAEGTGAAPLYRRVQHGIRSAIEGGALRGDDVLPGERDLARDIGVSRITVRRAVQELADEGLLVQRQGAGTFVMSRVEQPLSRLTSFTDDMTARGLTPGVEWLSRSVGKATPDEALALNLSPGSEVSRLYRLRSAADRPMCLEHATLPRTMLGDPSRVETSLYQILEQDGYRPVRALQRLRAQLFDEEHARLMGVSPGSACLYIERRSFLADGTPVELVRSHYRGDSYDFVAELQL